MKHIGLIFIAFCLCSSLFSQKEKGFPAAPETPKDTGVTRAVVVGISDYQDNGIPDLQYAHKDAEAFVQYLRSPAGGSLGEDDVQLLLNEKATAGRFAAALDWLMEQSKPGDRAIIYFSGHGDVERKTLTQPGFLLCWDAPSRVYMAGGTFGLAYLQEVISTLSVQNKARVVVITDACHAGKLAGSSVGGAQLTGSNLAKQFANETKILSCQPNEFSLEGAQWGGGRGVFSYHLIDGLTGLADRDSNATVNLFEVGRYLEDKVATEAAPHPQLPMTVGDRQTALASVDAPTLVALRATRQGQLATLSPTGSKNLEDEVLAKADSLTRAKYFRFKEALASGELLEAEPGKESADALFAQLIQKEVLQPLHGQMRRNFAAALQDEVQQALNALLDNDPYEANDWNYNPQKYARYPEYLAKTLELLGEKHYMAKALRAKKGYFDGYLLARSLTDENLEKVKRDSIKERAKSLWLEAASLEPGVAYLYHAIGSLYYLNSPAQTDSLLKYMEKALEFSPQWLLPYIDIATEWSGSLNNNDQSSQWLNKALKVSPTSYLVQERLSWLYQWQNRTDESLALSRKMMAEKPDLFNAWATAGVTCLMRKEFNQAERYFEKAMELSPNPNGNWAYFYRTDLFVRTRRVDEAITFSEQLLANEEVEVFIKSNIMYNLSHQLYVVREYELAEKYVLRLRQLNIVGGQHAVSFIVEGAIKIQQGYYEQGLLLIDQYFLHDSTDVSNQIFAETQRAIAAEMEGRTVPADSIFQRAINMKGNRNALSERLSLNLESAHFYYGHFLLRQNRLPEALVQFEINLREEPLGYFGPYGMALLSAKKGDNRAALDWLEKSLDRWYPEPESILEEPLFAKIRTDARFKSLMKKHFPEKFKD